MNFRSPRFLLLLLALFLVLTAGIAVTVVLLHHNVSTDVTIKWQVSSPSFSQQDQQDIQTAWKTILLASNPNRLARHEFTIIDVQRQGNWAIFSANERVNTDEKPVPTEPLFFLAHLQSVTWTVWMPGSSHFCDQLKQVPDTLLDPIDKHYFRGCYQ